ncbi:MAG: 1-acyl-sn-glycerol-3-phosphate acyltransferase [Clostridiales bacterium]|jgi:1-acyl-sn-glycerol-3-phosphate acyltransferase|nr:1-acyl-sn-glycerol-3-phosphate acyltransferase [Clostridiales bacterium]
MTDKKNKKKHTGRAKRAAKRRLHLFLKALLRPVFELLFHVRVLGKENYPKDRPVLLITNHLCNLDIPMILFRTPGYKRAIAKKELGNNKLFKLFASSVGVIFIDRGATDLEATREILTTLKEGDNLSLFPEGTRNRVNTELQELKPGGAMFALKGGAVVVPVMIYRRQKFFGGNYMYIDKGRRLSDLFGERADAGKLEAATKVMAAMMQGAKDTLADIVENRRWTALRRQKSARKRQSRLYARQAKKGLAALRKESKTLARA